MKYGLLIVAIILAGCGSRFDSASADKLLKSTRELAAASDSLHSMSARTADDRSGIYSADELAAATIEAIQYKSTAKALRECEHDIERGIATQDQGAIDRRRQEFLSLAAKLKALTADKKAKS